MELGMILRIVRGRAGAADVDALRTAATGPYDAAARERQGLRRFHVAVRPAADGGEEVVVLTSWDSVDDALRAYDGDLDVPKTLVGLSEVADFRDVAYFELDEASERRLGVEPAHLRLSVGRVARGGDADIQRELRQRMADLGPLLSEAWVARRIVGTDVEIAFISTWEREDPAHPLDLPLWPDISATYDAFEVAVYRPIASGPAGP
jgi:hypothetical protein